MGPQSDKYRLSVSGFSGDAGDALANPVNPKNNCNGMKFSTPDQDNDENKNFQCNRRTGWWFRSCSISCLNGGGNGKVFWNADTDEHIFNVQFARMLVKLD